MAAILAAAGLLVLVSGGICTGKAMADKEKLDSEVGILSERNAEAKELEAELDAMSVEYAERYDEYTSMSEAYRKDLIDYRTDLALYTATEAGLKQGREQMEEGYAELRMGWIRHDNALRELEQGEAAFMPGYEAYLAARRELEAGWEQYRKAEEMSANLPDAASLRVALNAVKASQAPLSSALDGLQAIANDPPVDPDTGEVDNDELQRRLTAQMDTIGAILSQTREAVSGAFTAEEIQALIAPVYSSLGEQTAAVLSGSASAEEMIAAASSFLSQGRSLSGSLSAAIDTAEQTVSMIEGLPAMKEQLLSAQAALDESAPAMQAALDGFKEGRAQLETLKNMLIYAEAELIRAKQTIEETEAEQAETREELDRRKAELEHVAERLEELHEQTAKYEEKLERYSDLRYALTADETIAADVREGGSLTDAADARIAQLSAFASRDFSLRLASSATMILSGIFAAFSVVFAFRESAAKALPFVSAGCFLSAAASEALSMSAGRGLLYSSLSAVLFALPVFLLNLRPVSAQQ